MRPGREAILRFDHFAGETACSSASERWAPASITADATVGDREPRRLRIPDLERKSQVGLVFAASVSREGIVTGFDSSEEVERDSSPADSYRQTPAQLTAQIRVLNDEVAQLRRRLAITPTDTRPLERQLTESANRINALSERNEKLVVTLRDARAQLLQLKEEVDRLAQPPSGYGVYVSAGPDGSVEVFTGGRRMRLAVSPTVEVESLRRGQQVRLNEALTVVEAGSYDVIGEVCALREVLEGGERALVVGHADEERVVHLAAPLMDIPLKPGDSMLVDSKAGYAYERVPKSDVEDLVLEEVPDVEYGDIGGLTRQIEQIRDAVELPFLHADLFREYQLRPPKGVLLYGPPGCGKTLIAKAVANSLAKQVALLRGEEKVTSYFLNIKGPELLNKYVGETERTIRLIFQRAREKASEGTPVIVFFDEMDSVFRTRGTGVSSDVETTIVPQLLAEIDGVEGLENVIVIGASNREDMIDPAILRPGRLDVKIKIERPDAEGARDIFSKYLTPSLPLHPHDLAEFGDDPRGGRADVHGVRGEPIPRGHLRERGQGGPLLQGLQLRRHDPEHRRPRE